MVELIPSDGDGLDEEERRALHADLDRSWTQAEAGRMRPAEESLLGGGRFRGPEGHGARFKAWLATPAQAKT